MSLQRVAVEGATLSTLSLGQGHPLLLLHGLALGNMASWYAPIALTLAQQAQVLLYDLRGHGDSTRSAEGYDLATQVEDLCAVLAHYALDTIDLAGHSVGALIALAFACRYPQRVRRLMLLDAPWPAATWVAPSLHAGAAALLHQQGGQDAGRRGQRRLQRLQGLLCETSLVAAVAAMRGEDVDDFHRLQMPVRLLYGRHSPCRQAADELCRHLPQASLHELEAGHYLLEEAAAEVCAHMQNYFYAEEGRDGSQP